MKTLGGTALLGACLALVVPSAAGQVRDGLTGHPLIDSILTAPAPGESAAPGRSNGSERVGYEQRREPPARKRAVHAASPPLPAHKGKTPKYVQMARAPKPLPSQPARARAGDEIDRMIGQMLLVGFSGQTIKDEGVRRVADQLSRGLLGGVLFLGRNIHSPRQLAELTRHLRQTAGDGPEPFLAVDQEGGYVQRLSAKKGFTAYPSAGRAAAKKDPHEAYETYRAMAEELARYGFNVNFGPVVDLDLNPRNPIIGQLKRSFGQDPATVIAYAKAFIIAHNQAGVLTAIKHFPGHGSSASDSHKQLVDISKSWKEAELEPYRELIKESRGDKLVGMVMVGHLYHPRFSDGPNLPASLSKQAIEGQLRTQLNYGGVVITDDLEMDAVRQTIPFEERLVRAVKAGNDILLLSNTARYQPDLPERAVRVLREAVERGELDVERIRTSYQRILTLKRLLRELKQASRKEAAPSKADSSIHRGG